MALTRSRPAASLNEFYRWRDLNSLQSGALNSTLHEPRCLCPLNELAEIRKMFRVALRNDNANTVHAKSIREHPRLRHACLILQQVRTWLRADIGLASPDQFASPGHGAELLFEGLLATKYSALKLHRELD